MPVGTTTVICWPVVGACTRSCVPGPAPGGQTTGNAAAGCCGPGEELRDRLLLVAAVRLVHRAQGLGVPAREHVRQFC